LLFLYQRRHDLGWHQVWVVLTIVLLSLPFVWWRGKRARRRFSRFPHWLRGCLQALFGLASELSS